jgi:hypothetical protein
MQKSRYENKELISEMFASLISRWKIIWVENILMVEHHSSTLRLILHNGCITIITERFCPRYTHDIEKLIEASGLMKPHNQDWVAFIPLADPDAITKAEEIFESVLAIYEKVSTTIGYYDGRKHSSKDSAG